MTQNAWSDQIVLKRIRERIAQRVLPCEIPRFILVSRVSGAACAGCDQPIADTEAAYELEFEHERRALRVNLHQRCYDIWDSECLERGIPAGDVTG